MIEGQKYQVKLLFASSPTSKVIQPGVVAFPGGVARVDSALIINEDDTISCVPNITVCQTQRKVLLSPFGVCARI
jgi:hypothetical protein